MTFQSVSPPTGDVRWKSYNSSVRVGRKLFVFGGHHVADAHTADEHLKVCSLDLDTHVWSELKLCDCAADAPRTASGLEAVHHGSLFYLIPRTSLSPNRAKSRGLIHSFNVTNNRWSRHATSGTPPSVIDSRTACVIGSSVYVLVGWQGVFVHALDLDTMTWSRMYVTEDTGRFFVGRAAAARENEAIVLQTRIASGSLEDRICIFNSKSLDLTLITPRMHPYGRLHDISVSDGLVVAHTLVKVGAQTNIDLCFNYQTGRSWIKTVFLVLDSEEHEHYLTSCICDDQFFFLFSAPDGIRVKVYYNGNVQTLIRGSLADIKRHNVSYDCLPPRLIRQLDRMHEVSSTDKAQSHGDEDLLR